MSPGHVPTALRCASPSRAALIAPTRRATAPSSSTAAAFEVPNRYRHLKHIEVRYAAWNLGLVHLVDERTGHVLARLYPQDKTQNASGLRRALDPISPPTADPEPTPATSASVI